MSKFIGIRHEDKYLMESRAPLTPRHIERLIKNKKLDIVVQSSSKRAFSDQEYTDAGAKIVETLEDCSVILGVKEIPIPMLEPAKTYVFFSHVAKGQPYNMPMLRHMMDLGCNLIDYEKITDEQGKRLIFFGRYAGFAGMINTLWALGLRLKEYGFETPFLGISQAHHYTSLEQAKKDISEVGREIAEKGLPAELQPFTVGITGSGNASQGAQDILGLFPVKEISPEKLLELRDREYLPNNLIYKVIFKAAHLSAHNDGNTFDRNDYYAHPKNYHNIFEKYIPHLTMLSNCMYWDPNYPRIVTKDYIEKLFSHGRPKLTVIGDITCDPDGSIEITHKGTEIEEPLFVYNPNTKNPTFGHTGEGMLVMAVDILPAELPRDSSEGFSDVLVNYIKPISDCDFSEHFEYLDLPKAIKKALILHNGELTPDFRYLESHLKHYALPVEPST
jgi:alpha-aminoadipic semialdehyde synthase